MTEPGVVLCYHRVREADWDPYALSVAPGTFAAHVAALSRDADIVPLAEIGTRGPRPRVALTFDDGYRDNLEIAAPILAAAGAPATFFVTTAVLDRPEAFWWDRLASVLARPARGAGMVAITRPDLRLTVDVRTEEGRARALVAFGLRLRTLAPAEQKDAVDEIAEQVGHRPDDGCEALDAAGLRALAGRGFEVAVHTRRHRFLPAAADDEAVDEIAGCVGDLAAVLGRAPAALAYPHGGVDPRVVGIARANGIDRAVTTASGAIRRGTDPLTLPRLVVEGWGEVELIARLTSCRRR